MPPLKTVTIVFDPVDRQDDQVYGDVAASDLIPVLRYLLARLESGALRVPMVAGEAWASCEPD